MIKQIKEELIKFVEDSDLDSISKTYLNHKINLNRITNNEELEKEISLEKRKTKLRKIVETTDLSYSSKSILFHKIQQNFILSEYELNKEFNVEKNKIESKIKKIEPKKIKNELRKIVENIDLNPTSKSNLFYKINNDEITYEYALKNEIKKEIRKEEERRKEEELLMRKREEERRIKKLEELWKKDEERRRDRKYSSKTNNKKISCGISAETYRKVKNVKSPVKGKYGW